MYCYKVVRENEPGKYHSHNLHPRLDYEIGIKTKGKVGPIFCHSKLEDAIRMRDGILGRTNRPVILECEYKLVDYEVKWVLNPLATGRTRLDDFRTFWLIVKQGVKPQGFDPYDIIDIRPNSTYILFAEWVKPIREIQEAKDD